MVPRVWINKLIFNNSQEVTVSKNDIVVLVGPNNAGKSATLKEAAAILESKNSDRKVVSAVDIGREGEIDDVLSYLEKHSARSNSPLGLVYKGLGYTVYETTARVWWPRYKEGISDLFSVFVNTLTTEQRLQAANPAKNIRITTDPIAHPIHFLQRIDELRIDSPITLGKRLALI